MYIGSVYIYSSVGNVWSRQSKILAADGTTSDLFGTSVCLYTSIAIIGAYMDDDKALDAGMYNSIINVILITADGVTTDSFGRSVSLYGSMAMIGVNGDDDKALDAGMNTITATGNQLVIMSMFFYVCMYVL